MERGIAAALMVGAAACGGESRADGPDWLTASAKPVTVKPVIDTTAAVVKVISAEKGGVLTAIGTDGTRYRLSIPAGALLSDASITMVPLSKVGGLPLPGGSVAAVHFEPSGLQLMKPATLTIHAESEIPVTEQVAFGYYGGGNDAHQVPLSGDSSRIEMKLLHFSGYGFGRAEPGDPGRQALQRAKSTEARLASRMAEVAGWERTGGKAGKAGDPRAAMVEYYDAVLRPLMQIAESDERMAACCMQRYFGWERSLQMGGMVGEDRAADATAATRDPALAELWRRREEGAASAVRIHENALKQGRERVLKDCRERHDLNAAKKWLELERQMALLGFTADDGFADTYRAMQQCFQFEVEFESGFENSAPHIEFVYHVGAEAPVDIGSAERSSGPLATAPLEYVRYVARMDSRATRTADGSATFLTALGFQRLEGVSTKPGTFSIHGFDWNSNPIEVPGVSCDGEDTKMEGDASDSLTITFQTGVPTEVARATYRYTPTAMVTGHDWAGMWNRFHGDAVIMDAESRDAPDYADPILRMTLTQVEPGVWRTEFSRYLPPTRESPATLTERGHLTVRHAPR